jgi:RimJ/RimL family protein N-acetyltransferase
MKYTTTEPWIKHPVIIKGRTIDLIPLEKIHFEELFKAASDKKLWELIPTDCSERSRFDETYTVALLDREIGKQYPFIIYHKASKKLIGSTRLFEISANDRKLEIGGSWIIREYWGTAVNLECKYLLLKFCFEELCTVRVQLKTDELNIRSRKAIEKIGGRFEGILRKDRIKDNGMTRNAAYYSILDDEWSGVKLKLENLLKQKTV